MKSEQEIREALQLSCADLKQMTREDANRDLALGVIGALEWVLETHKKDIFDDLLEDMRRRSGGLN